MISDDQIMKTQTCFLQEMAQKERIQPSTVDLVHLVPFCLSLVPTPLRVLHPPHPRPRPHRRLHLLRRILLQQQRCLELDDSC